MVFFGVYHLMALRFNLSMALGEKRYDIWYIITCKVRDKIWDIIAVCMTEDPTEKAINRTEVVTECPADTETYQPEPDTSDQEQPKEFLWSKSLQGLLLSCFFYGYILTQIIGGYFSDKVMIYLYHRAALINSLSSEARRSSWLECWPCPVHPSSYQS